MAAWRRNSLLADRACPQLRLRVPLTRCGAQADEKAVYVRSIYCQLPRPAATPPAGPAVADGVAEAAAAAVAQLLWHRARCGAAPASADPQQQRQQQVAAAARQVQQQPAKRSRHISTPVPACAGVEPAHRHPTQLPQRTTSLLLTRSLQLQQLQMLLPVTFAAPALQASDAGGHPSWLHRLRSLLPPQADAAALVR